MKNMTLKKRFIVFVGVLLAIMLSGGTYVFFSNQQAYELNEKISNKQIAVLNIAHSLKLAVVQTQQWLTDISATRGLDGLNDGFDEAENNAKLFKQLIGQLVELDRENASRYQAMLPVFNAYYETGKKMAHAYVKQGPAGGNPMMGQFDAVAEKMASEIDAFLEQSIEQTNLMLVKQADLMDTKMNMTMGIFALILLGVIALFFIVSHSLTYLGHISSALTEVSQGNLKGSIRKWKCEKDELGTLCESLHVMQSSLTDIITKVRNVATDLSDETNSMKALSGNNMELMRVQQQEVDLISTAIQDMSNNSENVASSANTAADSAQFADQNANQGKIVVGQAVESIKLLSNSVSNASHSIKKLREDSENIGGIIDVIKGIAEQTNLLALNAAIEAARAGEQGRGFAVVADEVRMLASRTQESTQEIQNMIEQLQMGSNEAESVMSQGLTQTDKSVEKSNEAVTALDEINQNIQSITQMNSEIAGESKSQSSIAKDMAAKVIAMNEAFAKTLKNSEKTVSASEDLGILAEDLRLQVSNFKL